MLPAYANQSQREPQNEQTPTFRAERDEVEVVVIVRDRNGNAIPNLTKDDFEVRDNGKIQPAAHDGQQRFLALFFDDLHTTTEELARVKKAARAFVSEDSRPEDRVALLARTESAQVTFTNDKQKLLATVDSIRGHDMEKSDASRCPRITDFEAFRTTSQQDPELLESVTQRLRNCLCPPPDTQGFRRRTRCKVW